MGDARKIQALLCLIAGVCLFLPLIEISAYNESTSITFMQIFDNAEKLSGVINGKIVLTIFISSFIMIIVRLKMETFLTKLVSLLLIIASGVLFYIDVDKISAAKILLSSMMKYGIGYYITLVSIVLALLLGLIDIFSNSSHSGYVSMNDMEFNTLKEKNEMNNNVINNNANNSINNAPIINKTPVLSEVKNEVNNQIKLSDIVNNNEHQ